MDYIVFDFNLYRDLYCHFLLIHPDTTMVQKLFELAASVLFVATRKHKAV